MHPFIYVAGPYSSETEVGRLQNTNAAIDVGNQLMDLGFNVYVPHLSHYMHGRKARHYEDWMRIDFDWITRCDGLFRMAGASSGGDREVEFAKSMLLPVFFNVEEMVNRYRGWLER